MVRREGTRFGVTTSQKVRRMPIPYGRVHRGQSVTVETKLDASEAHHAVRKQAETAVKKQLQRSAFDVQDLTSSKNVQYSLNKAKRWEVIEDIKEESGNVGHRSIIVEQHDLHRPRSSSSRACVGIFDSADVHKHRLPKKKYATVHDLMGKDGKQELEGEDEDFGKKNRRRTRRGKGVHQKEKEMEEERVGAPLSTIIYDVTLAPPRHTYQTYSNTATHSGHGKRNSRNRTGKSAQCSMQDAFSDGLWQLEEEDYPMEEMEDEEQYWQEETKDATPSQLCAVAMETLVNKAFTMGAVHNKENENSLRLQRAVVDTKAKKFPLDELDAIPYFTRPSDIVDVTRKMEKQKRRRRRKHEKTTQEKKVEETTPVQVPEEVFSEKPSVVVSVKTDDIACIELEGKFGPGYIEGQSMPRRFAISITDSIMDRLQMAGSISGVASMLQQTGHHIFAVVDCALEAPLRTRTGHSLEEEIRVKVCGVKEDKELLTKALTDLDNTNFSHVVDSISHAVAALPLESYLTESSVTSVATKPALNVETVKSVLGWNYDFTNMNKATEETLDSTDQSAETSESDEGVVPDGGASNDCESCGICFLEFDKTCPGTALIGCGHWFCDECWRSHLVARVGQGDTNITCPGFRCTVAVDKVTLMSLLPSKLYARHHGNKVNVALMLQQDHHWCPSPYCGRLLRLATASHHGRQAGGSVGDRGSSSIPVYCECGTFWCWQCKQEAHWPATCKQARAYRNEAKNALVVKQRDEIRVQAKRCPRCRYPIEKWYGCNHMVCKCGFEFCWDCGRRFDEDHYYCRNKDRLGFKKYILRNEESIAKTAIELAIIHHKKRSFSACHRRSRKARRLALKMAYPQTLSSSSSDSDTDDAASLRSSSTSLPATLSRGQHSQLQSVRRVLDEVANFLSEAEFVLEHLEILLSSVSRSNQRRVLSQHKNRLVFITENLHKILDEQAKLDMVKVEHQLHCGKSCLRLIAVAATHLTNIMGPATMEE